MSLGSSFLRFVFVLGAVLDGVTLIPMLVPRVAAAMYQLGPEFLPGPDYGYAVRLAASLMLGWTLLLLWACARPVERRDVALLTVVVIAGLGAAGGYAVHEGMVQFWAMVPTWVWQCIVSSLFLSSWFGSFSHKRWDRIALPLSLEAVALQRKLEACARPVSLATMLLAPCSHPSSVAHATPKSWPEWATRTPTSAMRPRASEVS
ncbi:hypothetical protein Pelo_18543 [Pelomyxa schiedti]|nr:hypothetical protein Pelo_18543 [Pelomyxa schiedti]